MGNTITALDTQTLVDVGLVQPEQTQESAEPNTTEAAEPTAETQQEGSTIPTTTPVTTVDIDGIGSVSVNDIKEWQRGSMRQSDYTRKTQELARQREEMADAIEVFNYLQQNPNIVEQLKAIDEHGVVNTNVVNKTTPESAMMKQLWFNQKSMEIDKQVDNLKSKYGDIDEVLLFNTAAKLKTDDLEFVYRALAFENKKLDEKAIIEKAKEELKRELAGNKASLSTVVSTNVTQRPTTNTITNEERRVAEAMGISADDYMKWKNK